MATGDHIQVKRKAFISYYHHGIDIGNERVIHFSGGKRNKKNAKVVEASISDFLQGGKKEVVEYGRFLDQLEDYKFQSKSSGKENLLLPSFLDSDSLEEIKQRIENPERTVSVAKKHLGKSSYSLVSNNCEHFAIYCKTGLHMSLQIIKHDRQMQRIAEVLKPDSSFGPIRFPL